jgi:FixJ family two-component response regulator
VSCIKREIFVIDDDSGMRKSLSVLLGNSGYSTSTYHSAEAFLATLEVSSADRGCVVLDMHLEGMSGVELARHLVRMGSHLPIIFITGNDSDRERKAALQPNCVAYLSKPFSAAVLLDAIDRALRNCVRIEDDKYYSPPSIRNKL